ncbi:SLBB domain-containing protein [Geobacter sp.]|uniref:SLBB domain-containing protein n=1 Tax=Geobacter sp. TaxID=46610 RepID=UPI00262C6855|nr:SLBB domain-containing protein [Geobacter sp.]
MKSIAIRLVVVACLFPLLLTAVNAEEIPSPSSPQAVAPGGSAGFGIPYYGGTTGVQGGGGTFGYNGGTGAPPVAGPQGRPYGQPVFGAAGSPAGKPAAVTGTAVQSAPGQPSLQPALPPQQLPAGKNLPGEAPEGAPKPRKEAVTEEKAPAPSRGRGIGEPEYSLVEKTLNAREVVKGAEIPAPSLDAIEQFGYSFFRPDASDFSPLTDIPVGPDYVVGPGDTIVVNAWGSLEGTFPLEVNRSGEVVLPKVGPVKVWGLPFGKLQENIRGHLARVYRDFQINVNMGKLKLMKIYIVGEVQSPGDYNVSSLSTVINALSAAGGPTKTGSLRTIQVKRGGKVAETVDLYDFFLSGDKSRDIRLLPGDTVFVPVIGPVVGVAGNVKRPAIYELKGEKTLKDLLVLADGLLPTGYLQRVQISRVAAHEKKVVADFSIDPGKGGASIDEMTARVPIQDMDVVRIFTIDTTLRGYVRLEGHVLRPGDYALKPGMRVSQLLGEASLLPEYYDGAAGITRLLPPDYQPEKFAFNPAKALAGDPQNDIELKEFDVVHIFSRWDMEEMPRVKIYGEVQRPGEYRLFRNMTVRDLVIMAGNPKLTAYLKRADINRITHSGESVTSSAITLNLGEALHNNPKDNIVLQPFDELYVRRIPNWAEETERHITLKGEFKFPGEYPIYKGEKLSTVIERAGGFTDRAYLKAAKFTRVAIQELQQKRMNEVIAKTEQEILKKEAEIASVAASKEELEATRAALESLKHSVELLKSAKAEGRLVIHLADLADFRNGPYDVEVQGGDVLEVPQIPNAVNVLGQVYNPTSLIPVEREDVAYYLDKAGGPTRDAEKGDIYVVRADGTVLSRQQVSMFRSLFFNGFMSTKLDPGDTVVVPQRFEKVAWVRDIKDIATILGQLALAAGVIVAAGL